MKTPHLAMVAIPDRADAAVRWGTRTPAELAHEPVRSASPAATGIVVYQGATGRDIEEPQRAQLVTTAACVLRSPSFKNKIRTSQSRADTRCSLWFLWESGNRLRTVAPDAVSDATNALLTTRHTHRAHVVPPALVHFTTDAIIAGITLSSVLAAISRHLDPLTATPAVGHGRTEPATLVIGEAPDDADQRAVLSFRESLLAAHWPDSKTVGRQLGSTDAGAEARASRERAAGTIFAVWAGRHRGGYQHPAFQFQPSGSPHPRIPELLDALARRPDLAPTVDRSGWERAFWLYQPRGALSEQALALAAATPAQVRADPERFMALPDAARTPADVFLHDPQAVIDLARDDAAAQTPPEPAVVEGLHCGE